MPIEFWTQGWLLQLSPTATALLFALREALGGHSEPQYIPTTRRQRYGLSSDTWTRGRKELEAQGLLAVKREPQGTFYDFTRLRNAYQLTLARLDDSPSWT
jgi:DNA-binding winged helix-turn-helix (wHTH) protein